MPLKSNRERGDGRYDNLFERKDYSVLFEQKPVADAKHLEAKAAEALR